LRLEAIQWTVCASTDVSDSHALPSHELCPVRLQAEYAVDPRLSPYAVTRAAPVDPAFDIVAVLRSGGPTDKSQVALPTARPTVWDSLALRIIAATARHVAEVSPAQSVDSLDVEPSLTRALKISTPRPDPYTVTLDDPVEA
jgi:hypothetical protein